MLLSDEITLTFDFRTFFSIEEFQYKMTVHNHDEKEALISVRLIHIQKGAEVYNIILEYEQLKIPHNLKAKEWLIKIIIEKDRVLKNFEEYNFTEKDKVEMRKIKKELELKYQKIKIDGF